MRTYELTCIFRVDEDNFTRGKSIVSEAFSKYSAKSLKETDLGVKELAYEIKKETKGHYYYYEIEAQSEKIEEMDRDFRFEAPFLKYLFVKKED